MQVGRRTSGNVAPIPYLRRRSRRFKQGTAVESIGRSDHIARGGSDRRQLPDAVNQWIGAAPSSQFRVGHGAAGPAEERDVLYRQNRQLHRDDGDEMAARLRETGFQRKFVRSAPHAPDGSSSRDDRRTGQFTITRHCRTIRLQSISRYPAIIRVMTAWIANRTTALGRAGMGHAFA